jgi:hypothetical protein
MNTLNQVTKAVVQAKKLVNSQGIHIAHIANSNDHITVIISPAYGKTKLHEFWREQSDMKKALLFIKEYAVPSPTGTSSATDGNLLGVTV